MALTTESYTGNGSQKEFQVASTILSESHVRVHLNDGSGDTLVSSELWDLLGSTILFETAPEDGVAVKITVSSDGEGLDDAPTSISSVAANINTVITVGDNIADVNTVAGSITNVNTAAGSIANINTVATNISDVNDVADNMSDINDVQDHLTNIDTVAGVSTDVDTVAGISANVTTVAGISSNVTTVATNNTNVTTVATNIANVNTVAGIDSDVSDVAAIDSDVTAVANNNTNVTTVAGIDSDVTIVANAITGGAGIGGGQYYGNGLIKGIEYFNQNSTATDDITVVSWLNAMSVESFTLADGASLTIENGAVYKVV